MLTDNDMLQCHSSLNDLLDYLIESPHTGASLFATSSGDMPAPGILAIQSDITSIER